MGRIFDAPIVALYDVHSSHRTYKHSISLTNSLTNSCNSCHFAHQFAHQSCLLPYTLTNKSPHSSKVRSPIRQHPKLFVRLTAYQSSLIQELRQMSCLNLARMLATNPKARSKELDNHNNLASKMLNYPKYRANTRSLHELRQTSHGCV